MATNDTIRKVVKLYKKKMDEKSSAFITTNKSEIFEELKKIESSFNTGKDNLSSLEAMFSKEGILIYPEISTMDKDDEGYTRLYRAGTTAGNVLNAILYPGNGSDSELGMILNRIKKREEYSGGDED